MICIVLLPLCELCPYTFALSIVEHDTLLIEEQHPLAIFCRPYELELAVAADCVRLITIGINVSVLLLGRCHIAQQPHPLLQLIVLLLQATSLLTETIQFIPKLISLGYHLLGVDRPRPLPNESGTTLGLRWDKFLKSLSFLKEILHAKILFFDLLLQLIIVLADVQGGLPVMFAGLPKPIDLIEESNCIRSAEHLSAGLDEVPDRLLSPAIVMLDRPGIGIDLNVLAHVGSPFVV